MKFDINNYKGNYAMHCKTKAEAEDFCRYMREHCSNMTLKPQWYSNYKERTAYNISGYSYANIEWYKTEGYTILEWSDFMNKKFTKADLKDGMVVEFANGHKAIVIGNRFIGKGCFSMLNNWSDTLEHCNSPFKFITKVYTSRAISLTTYLENHNLTLIWERPKEDPVKEMTVAEIEKALGYKVKIVFEEN